MNVTSGCRGRWCRGRARALRRRVVGLAALAIVTAGSGALAADVRIVAPNAVKEVVTAASARYERASGNRVVLAWGGSEAIAKRIGDGEVFDVVVNTPQAIDALVADGRIVPGSRSDFAKSGIGIAVRAGAPRPDVSDEEALRKALLTAGTVGISSGPSGRYLSELFRRLGIADEMQRKVRQPPSGAQIAELLARGEVDLGFQQVSELQHAGGVDYLGPLPAALQNYTVWSAGLHRAASDPDAGRAFLAILVSPELAAVVRTAGMEPVQR